MTSASDYIEFKAFIKAERDCIDKDKWFEGIKLSSDPGQEFILHWIDDNSQEFRNKWDESMCRCCVSAFECGHYLRKECNCFKERK